MSIQEVEKTLDEAIGAVTNLEQIYCRSDVLDRRKIIGSIFLENFTFENLKDRTAAISEIFKLICLINRGLQGKKNGTTDFYSQLSHRVTPLRLELRTHRLRVCCSTN